VVLVLDLLILALLVLIILILGISVFFLLKQNRFLKERLEELIFKKISQSVKYGKLTEQFIPFTKDFPFNSEKFRFLGTPIDGMAFEDEKIIFCEFKTGSSNLSSLQQKIKNLVKEKKVEWFEFKMR